MTLRRGTVAALDTAWAEAEAALPEGAQFWAGRAPETAGWYFAVAVWGNWLDAREREHSLRKVERTPAAALRALAAALRERP